MLRRVLFLFYFICSSFLYSQYNICNLHSNVNDNIFNCLTENEDMNILNIDFINNIVEQVGISNKFIFKICHNTENAIAVINPLNNKRYILYDINYFNKKHSNIYIDYYIIAHEIGHHLNGHTIANYTKNYSELQNDELEADFFAGYILYKLGAKEKDIIETFNIINNPTTIYSSHPKNEKRIDHALKGYLNEYNKHKDILYALQEKIKEEKYNELIQILDKYTIYKNKKDLDIALHLLNNLDKENKYFKQIRAYIHYNLGNYNESYNIYKRNYLKSRNDDDLIYLLDILDNSNIIDPELNSELFKILTTTKNPKILLNLGIFYQKNNQESLSKESLSKAYEIIKNESESLLQSDIYFAYARILYNEELEKKNQNFSYSKILLIKAKNIIEKYPNNIDYKLYYNSILFHLGNIQFIQNDYINSVKTYKKLLELEHKRIDFIYKTNHSLSEIYRYNDKYQEAIKYITIAIEICDNQSYKSQYYFERAALYKEINEIELLYKDLFKACELENIEACNLIKH